MTNQLFTKSFFYYSQDISENIRAEVQRLNAAQLTDPDALVDSIATRYRLTELNIDWDTLAVLPEHREEESYVHDMFGDNVRSVTPVYTFEIKYTGSPVLFTIQPSSSRMMHLEGSVSDQKLSFEIRGSDNSRLNQIKEGIKFNVDNQKNEVGSHNSGVENTARIAVERRKQELNEQDQGRNDFGVPIKSDKD